METAFHSAAFLFLFSSLRSFLPEETCQLQRWARGGPARRLCRLGFLTLFRATDPLGSCLRKKKTRLRGCRGGKWTSCRPLSDVFQTTSLSGSKLHSSLLLQHLQKADKGIGPASPGAGLPIRVPTISSRARLTTTLTPWATVPSLLPI